MEYLKFKRITLILSVILFVTVLSSTAYTEQNRSHEAVTAVEAIGMTVADMDRSIEFYSKILSFELISDVEVWGERYERLYGVFGARMRVVRLKLGHEFIELTHYLTPTGRVMPSDARSNDHWFQHIAIVVSDMNRAYRHLKGRNIQHVSTAPQRIPDWNKGAAGIRAFYFQDPDEHNLEIIYFPPGKGEVRWQDSEGKLFLGLDHTAIVVSDTVASLKFYRDVLGMRVSGQSENYGTEQEQLNNVFGARLLITGLRAESGPGIEFLEYLTPGNGRPMPLDEQSNDLMHWQTTLRTGSTELLTERLRDAGVRFISSGTIDLPKGKFPFERGLLVRDPDGHAIQIVD